MPRLTDYASRACFLARESKLKRSSTTRRELRTGKLQSALVTLQNCQVDPRYGHAHSSSLLESIFLLRYAATAFVDFLSFVYVALFYNHVEAETQSLSEITYEHVVPFKYLVTLIVLFMLIVLDRLFYTLGSPLGKALLHST